MPSSKNERSRTALLTKGVVTPASRVQQRFFVECLEASNTYGNAVMPYNFAPGFIEEVSTLVSVITGFKCNLSFTGPEIADLLLVVAKGDLLQYRDESCADEEAIGKGSVINLVDFFEVKPSAFSVSTEVFIIPETIHNKLEGVFILALKRRAFLQCVFKMDKARFGQNITQIPFFAQHISKDEISRFSLHAETASYKKNNVILEANDEENAFCFFIISGFVCQKSDSILMIIYPTDYFGHDKISSPENKPCPHSFVAISDVVVLKVELSSLQKSPSIMKVLTSRSKRSRTSSPVRDAVKTRHHHTFNDVMDRHRVDIMAVNALNDAGHKKHHHRHHRHHSRGIVEAEDNDSEDDDFSTIVEESQPGVNICSLEAVLWWIPGLFPPKKK